MSVLACFRLALHHRAYNFYYFCGMCFVSIEKEIGLSVGVEEISSLLCHKNDTKAIYCE